MSDDYLIVEFTDDKFVVKENSFGALASVCTKCKLSMYYKRAIRRWILLISLATYRVLDTQG